MPTPPGPPLRRGGEIGVSLDSSFQSPPRSASPLRRGGEIDVSPSGAPLPLPFSIASNHARLSAQRGNRLALAGYFSSVIVPWPMGAITSRQRPFAAGPPRD